jgi:BTB/POZ domain-containing protein 9
VQHSPFQAAVDQLLSRDSFCAPEIDIFKAVREWTQVNVDADTSECEMLVAHVRLPLMKLDELLNIVRPSMLIQPDRLLDAIKEQSEKRDMDLHYRGCLMPSVNVATQAQGAQVVDGELKQVGVVRCSKCAHTQALLNGDTVNYDMERGFTRHPIEDTSEGIIVQLGVQSIVNHIRLLLWDKDARSYSYYVEVSMDRLDWVRVVSYNNYLCRSWQKLYFTPKVVK